MSGQVPHELSMAERHEQWMVKHNRVYKDEAEKERRLQIFSDKVQYIESFNAEGNHMYTLGINQFTDLTDEEFRAMYLITLPESLEGKGEKEEQTEKVEKGKSESSKQCVDH